MKIDITIPNDAEDSRFVVNKTGKVNINAINNTEGNLLTPYFKKVQKFFDTMPKLKHKVKVKNPKTKKNSEVELVGLNDFFA